MICFARKMWIYRPKHGVFLFVMIFISLEGSPTSALKYFNIGAMLSSPKSEQFFDDAVRTLNQNSTMSLSGVRLNSTASVLSTNPIRSALDVCDNVITKSVYLILVSHSTEKPNPPIAISYACGFYNIPVIGIASRESIFSDKVFFSWFLSVNFSAVRG